jgi:transcriptional activator HAC1
VSVGRATALDALNADLNPSDNTSYGTDTPNFWGRFFNHPEPTLSDNDLLEGRVLDIADSFNLEDDYLDFHNNSVADDSFNINEFLHHDENNQPAPKVQSSDSLAESTASLQPQFGASTHGCDDGGNAVSV